MENNSLVGLPEKSLSSLPSGWLILRVDLIEESTDLVVKSGVVSPYWLLHPDMISLGHTNLNFVFDVGNFHIWTSGSKLTGLSSLKIFMELRMKGGQLG